MKQRGQARHLEITYHEVLKAIDKSQFLHHLLTLGDSEKVTNITGYRVGGWRLKTANLTQH